MPLFKKGCRSADRTQIKKMDLEGFKVHKIAERVRIEPAIVERVISGEWDAQEKLNVKRQQELNAERIAAKATAEETRIAQAVAAAMKAMQGAPQAMTAADMRKQLEAEVRAELEAEAKAATEAEAEPELTRGQKAAATRAANKAASAA